MLEVLVLKVDQKTMLNPAYTLQAGDWTCQECANERDLGTVEAQLLCVVRRRVKAYQLQDSRCTKCKQVCFNSFGRLKFTFG